MSLKEHLQELNHLHKSLREALIRADDEQAAIRDFIALHAQLHASQVSPDTSWSY